MQRSDGQPQPRRTGGTGGRGNRKTGDPHTTGYADTTGYNQQITDDDLDFADDTAMSRSTHQSTGGLRRSGMVPPSRTANVPITPITNRRSQPYPSSQQAMPQRPTQPYRGPRKPSSGQSRNQDQDQKQRIHWLLFVGVGMIVMLVVWVLGSSLLAWINYEHDNIVYGTPRTYQTDAVVGHGGDSQTNPSHFIAVNLNRQIIIVEFMAGNPSKSIDYVVPYNILGQGGNLTPVTLKFCDATGNGKLDMIVDIHLSPQDQTFVFVNDGSKFRAPTSKDNIHLC